MGKTLGIKSQGREKVQKHHWLSFMQNAGEKCPTNGVQILHHVGCREYQIVDSKILFIMIISIVIYEGFDSKMNTPLEIQMKRRLSCSHFN